MVSPSFINPTGYVFDRRSHMSISSQRGRLSSNRPTFRKHSLFITTEEVRIKFLKNKSLYIHPDFPERLSLLISMVLKWLSTVWVIQRVATMPYSGWAAKHAIRF